MITRIGLIIGMLALSATPARAQFQMPLPPALGRDTTCAIKIVKAYQDQTTRDSLGIGDRCRIGIDSLRLDTLLTRLYQDRLKMRQWAIRGPSVMLGDIELRKLYGNDAISFFSSFAGLLGEETMYLSSSVLAGIIGRFHFDFSFAQVVSSQDTGTSALTRAEFRDATSRVMRLVNNGGSGTARMLVPLFAGGGTVTQRAAAVYVNAGVLGPLSRSDSLTGTFGVAADLLTTYAIRDPNSYALVGDIMLGLRTGYQYVSERWAIAPNQRGQSLAFLQVAAGVRGGGFTRLAVLYTLINGPFQDFMPALQVSVQTSGF